ncbi:hypothetical protein BDZ89DRAFT_1097924 [Hymenopellis radicata]|nr:hypothetical protein BDZ89DRAFT_1097924 [Hymenopellis radicata]
MPASPTRQTKKRKKNSPYTNLEDLQGVRNTSKKQFGRSKNTQGQYDGVIKRAEKWLAETCKARLVGDTAVEDGIDTQVLKTAFASTPNYLSSKALELYLVDQCFVKELKHQTGDKIFSAFNDLWRRCVAYAIIAGFIGDYSFDKERKTFSGNPAQQFEVKELVKSILKRDKEGGESAKRNHAEAFLVEEVDAILAASRAVCPDTLVEMAIRGELTHHQTEQCLEHALMRAFFTSGFVLWTRNFELCKLTRANIDWYCCKRNPPYSHYFTVFLENRKGWQKKSDYECSLESNTYEIHPPGQHNTHAALDMYQALPLWVRLYEFWIGRNLLPDELIFPNIGAHGIIQTREIMPQNTIQALITKFAVAAGLKRAFTTHSLRRGGAQFRFMWDKVGRRWSLRKVRWWGGWAEGETVDTLMKYLLDSLSKYEENYGDALDPGRADRADIFLGEQISSAPVSNATFESFAHSMSTMMYQCNMATFQSVTAGSFMPPYPSYAYNVPSYTYHALLQPQLFQPGYQYPPPPGLPSAAFQASPPSISSINYDKNQNRSQQPAYSTTSVPHPTSLVDRPQLSMQTTFAVQPALVSMNSETAIQQDRRKAVIPKLPRGKPREAWRMAVKQWNEVDPSTGYALKNWPESWYQGRAAGQMGNTRNGRELVAFAFENLRAGSDAERFEEQWPEARKSYADLCNAIRRKYRVGRSSINGTPEERRKKKVIEPDDSDDSDFSADNNDNE